MANRDPSVFDNPNEINLARTGSRQHSFGLGIHRCIGSNVARMVFKRMITAVLDRMPDFQCDPAGAVHYETIGVIQGMQHLPATFTVRNARLRLSVDEPAGREGTAIRAGGTGRHRGLVHRVGPGSRSMSRRAAATTLVPGCPPWRIN